MDGASSFFWTVLVLQIVFSLAVTVIVARRSPQRARAYRFAAPAALPVMLMLMVGYGYWRVQQAQGLAFHPAFLGRFAIAYLVLWLIGVLAASIALRRFRR